MLFTLISKTGPATHSFGDIARRFKSADYYFQRWQSGEELMEIALFDWLRVDQQVWPENADSFNMLVDGLITFYQGGEPTRHFKKGEDLFAIECKTELYEVGIPIGCNTVPDDIVPHCARFWFSYRAWALHHELQFKRPIMVQRLFYSLGLIYRPSNIFINELGKR